LGPLLLHFTHLTSSSSEASPQRAPRTQGESETKERPRLEGPVSWNCVQLAYRTFCFKVFLLCVVLISCGAEHPILIEDAWVRKIMPSQSVTAGYLTLSNAGPIDDKLLSVSSPAFEAVEMHEMAIDEKSVMRMRKSGPLLISAHGTLELRSGGYHLMLIGPHYEITAGNDIPLTLTFEHAGDVTVAARVREQK